MKRLFLGIAAASLAICLCVGCSDNSNDSASLNYSIENEQNNFESQQENNAEPVSSDWRDLDVRIDGKSCVPMFDYNVLSDNGWVFDPATYGLEDLQLEKGTYLSCDVFVHNQAFDDGIISIGITNTDDEKKSVTDAKVYGIKINVKDKMNRPSITVPGNFDFGASAYDIKTALGEPNEIIRNDEQAYDEYVYKDNNKEVHYYIYDSGNMLGYLAECF